jgi:hypothetical protein
MQESQPSSREENGYFGLEIHPILQYNNVMAVQRFLAAFILALLVGVAVHMPVHAADDQNAASNKHVVQQVVKTIPLIQPLNDTTTQLPVGTSPAGTFIAYFNMGSSWLISVAVGIATLWVLVCGGAIVVVGHNDGQRSEWMGNMKRAIGGLIALVFAGSILRFLNSAFFTS